MTAAEETFEVPVYSMNVTHTVRELQQAHGLKSFDYMRYRSYCTRRLTRIHKVLRLTNGTQKKFKGLVVMPEDVTDDRVLLMLILQVERAWAYSEQLKYDFSQSDDARQYRHYASRIKRAQKHGATLQDIANQVCDDRTKKEIAAYVQEMNGHAAVSKKEWEKAKADFTAARSVYVALGEAEAKAGPRDSYTQRASDLEKNLRFCTYNLGEDGVRFGAQGVVRKGGGATTVLKWQGTDIEVTSEKVRLLLATASEALGEAQALAEQLRSGEATPSALAKYVETFDKAFLSYSDAMQHVKSDIAQEKQGDQAMLHLLVNCLKFTILQHTLERNKTLAHCHSERLEAQELRLAAGLTLKKAEKQSSAIDIARLHETVIQTIDSMLAIPGVEDDAVADPLNAQQLLHTALKQFYQAEAFKGMGEWAHAMPLYNAAVEAMGQALVFSRKNSLDESEVLKCGERIRAARCVCKATAVLREEDSGDKPAAKRLDRDHKTYKACDEITGIPPDYVTMAARPIFLDIAKQCLPKPSVEHRVVADKKGQKPSIKAGKADKPAAAQNAPAQGAAGDDKKGWFGGWGWNKPE